MTDAQPDEWGLLPEDDQFHPPETDDPWWTETVWFSWMVPERNLLGYFYPAFRANMGIQFGGVLVVDDTAVVPWELPAFEWSWHEPLDRAARPARHHEPPRRACGSAASSPVACSASACDNDDLSFDLTFEALCRPLLTRQEPPFNHGAHVDQPGRVTGSFTLHGEAFEVDCIAMRDRSWGVRRAGRQPKIGYDHGTASADDGFLSHLRRPQGRRPRPARLPAARRRLVEPGRRHTARSSATPSTGRPASRSRRSTSSAARCTRSAAR